MSAERLALCTTIYPGVEPFLAEWYQSVEAQTDRDFDLWIALDALTPSAAAAAIGRTPKAEWIETESGATPARIRTAALARLIDRYPAVVLVDSDDILYPSRVAAARRMLQHADLSACALDVMDARGRDLGVVLEAPADADPAGLLPRCNVFGLSNTAYRSATLRDCLPAPEDCVLIDWLLATRAWFGGATLCFDPTPGMRYRQYAANLAPFLPPFDAEQVLAATGRVLAHYRCVLDNGWPVPVRYRQALERERTRVSAFDAGVRGRPEALSSYVEQLNRLPPMRVWWWQVAHPQLEALWSS